MTSIWASAAEHFEERPDYSKDPLRWVRDRMPGVQLWSKQIEILEAVRDHRNVAVQSAHNVGKTWIASLVIAWFIESHPPGQAFVVSTAPTGAQVKALLWRELSRRHREGNLSGRMNQTEWYNDIGELVGMGRSISDWAPTSSFSGIHSDNVLFCVDESSGVARTIWDAGSSLTSNEGGKNFAIGNPDDSSSEFAEVCVDPDWHTIKISAFDSPNFTGEPASDRLKRSLISKTWVEERARKWGKQSPIYIAKVLGEFATDSVDGVVPLSWANRCRWLDLPDDDGEPELGLDVSAGGSDRTVLWLRAGRKAVRKWEWRGESDPLVLADSVLAVIQETGATSIKVDSIGVGWGIGGILDGWHRDGRHDCVTVPVCVSESADDDEQFLNRRVELWWGARERSRLAEWDLGALDEDDLAELTATRYHTKNPRGRTQAEKKDDVRKRLGSSPDSADALLLAFHTPTFEATSFVEEMTAARLPSL